MSRAQRFWGRSKHAIGGLCGISHGASGVALALLELGRYVNHHYWSEVAEQAIAYERFRFDADRLTWRDLRKSVATDESYRDQKAAYERGDVSFFVDSFESDSWCNGAGGIGLTRLRAFEELGVSSYREEATVALKRTRGVLADPQRSPTLCHGGGGLAELLLESWRVLGDVSDLELAQSYSLETSRERYLRGGYKSGARSDDDDQEDANLFTGNAGIGYMYLRVLDPVHTPSILAFRIPRRSCSAVAFIAPAMPALPGIVLSRLFPRTLWVVRHVGAKVLSARLEDWRSLPPDSLPHAFDTFIQELAPGLPGADRDRLCDLWALEHAKACLDNEIVSFSLLHMKSLVLGERVPDLLSHLLDVQLLLDPMVVLHETQWDWVTVDDDHWHHILESEPQTQHVILCPRWQHVMEESLSAFAHAVLLAFRHPCRVEDAVAVIAAEMALDNAAEQAILKDAIVAQVIEAVSAGLLSGVGG